MRSPKFKVGDEVIYFGKDPTHLPAKQGQVYKVFKLNVCDNSLIYLDNQMIMVRDDEIELARIYNSPLYQALL